MSSDIENERPEENVLYEEVARRIRAARLREGLTQADLADRIGAKKSYIFELERGTGNPTLRTLHRLGKAMDRAPADFLPDSIRPLLNIENVKFLTDRCEGVLLLLARRDEHQRTLIKEEVNAIKSLRDALRQLASAEEE